MSASPSTGTRPAESPTRGRRRGGRSSCRRAAIDDGRPHHLLCLAVAGWLRFLRGADYAGEDVPIQGPRPDLVPLAQEAGGDATPLLSERSIFDHVGRDPRFADCVQQALTALDRQGPREVIEEFLAAGARA